MRALPSVCLLLALLAVSVPALGQSSPPRAYTLTDAFGPGQETTTGTAGLSDTGFVCGYTLDAASNSVAFLWSPGSLGSPSTFSRLDPPAGGWGNHVAVDVNDAGVVVGSFGPPGFFFQSQGFRWKDGVSEELFTAAGFSGIPYAINDAGWIVGTGLWDPDLVPTTLPLDIAYDINDRGQIVGFREEGTAQIARGYLLDQGNVIPLGTLDPRNRGDVFPVAINNSGHVVGESWVGIPPNDRSHAFLWTPAAGMTELLSPYPGLTGYATAYDINDAGWVVGYAPVPGGVGPMLWAPDGTPTEIAPLVDVRAGTRFWWSLAINEAGQIAGGALSASKVRIVLLTPAALQASALTPGVAGVANSLTVGGARANRATFLFGDLDDGLDQGYTRLPGCGPLGVALATPHFVSAALADGSGSSVNGWNVPASLAGVQVRLQALQLGGCGVSNVVRVAF